VATPADTHRVSAVAVQPRPALGRLAVRVAVAPLTLLVTASVAVRILVGWLRATPAYFPDEYMYAEFSRSLAAGHLPVVRGEEVHFLPLLQPLLTAPAWLLPSVEQGYRAAQAVDAVAMSLAAIPIYLLARRVGLSARSALAAAALGLTVPSFMLSSFIMSEPFAYPIALGAVAAGVHALDRPGGRSYGLFLALTALAMFTRMQFAVLVPCFVVALVLVAVREGRVREFLRAHRLHLGALLLVSAALFALGPARNTGYYPSFSFVPGFDAPTAARVLAADALVLAFAGGFVLVPGMLLGLGSGLRSPRRRAELAFTALTLALTVGLLVEAVVYGHLDYVQERYLFYLLPLWTIAFLLHAQRGWPRRTAHALLGFALVVAALVFPLARYAAGDEYAHSAFLFALRRLGELLGSPDGAALAIVLAGAAAGAAVIAATFLAPRRATAVALALAFAATGAATAGAVSFDLRNTRAIHDVTLGGDPTWVDDAKAGRSTMVLLPGSRNTDATLFWNRSIDGLVLFPGLEAPDSFAAPRARIAPDGTVLVGGRTLSGNVVLATRASTPVLWSGATLASSTEHVLVRLDGPLRLRLLAVGRYSDGWLDGNGLFILWPDAGGTLAGRLVLPVRPPGDETVTLRFAVKGAEPIVRRAAPGRLTNVVVPVCSTGPLAVGYSAGPVGSVGDGRGVAAATGMPYFVPSPGAC
jgi:4-amino-4-deoxy-L-arabinose transferase-like glycosyltransferase